MKRLIVTGLVLFLAQLAPADLVISEWMYSGTNGEFVEFTNIGPDPIDMTGWSFDDDSQVPGTVDLSAFGVVYPGQSVILTEAVASEFAAAWGLSGVAIIGSNTANLGRNDQINLYDAGNNLVDQLSYGDQAYPGTPRTQYYSCNIPATDYGYTVAQTSWVLAAVGDVYGSWASTGGDVGSPGIVVQHVASDFDYDGDVDMADFAIFNGCMTGPFIPYDPPPSKCTLEPDAEGIIAADIDRDGDADLADFVVVQSCFSGEGNLADPACAEPPEPPAVTEIILNGSSITVNGAGVTVNGTTATIVSPGTYRITGSLLDGQIVVNTSDNGLVEIIFNGISVSNSRNAPFYVMSAAQTEIVLAAQTANYLYDPSQYVYDDPEQDEPNASLFSKDSLKISGTGSLTVYGNYHDGVTSKDDLVIAGGTMNVIAVDDGIRGKDYLLIEGGHLTVTSGGDGLKSDNADDPLLGYITIHDGSLSITSGGDAIAAETDVTITGGEFSLFCAGGHTATLPPDLSAKGIKGLARVTIEGGSINIDAADDGVHSNNAVTVRGGVLTIATGDDGIHADVAVTIEGGTINLPYCYEGIEGADITITEGDIDINSSDDGITADYHVVIADGDFNIVSGGGHTVTLPSDVSAKGIKGLSSVAIGGGTFNLDCADDGVHSDGAVTISGGTLTIATNSSTTASYGDGIHADGTINITGGAITVTTCYEGIEAPDITIDNGTIRVTSTNDGINAAGHSGLNNYLRINGGYIAVYAAGDGIDVNGHITMTGGTVLVHGPTVDYDSALDFDGTFKISGGFLVAAGSAGMAQAPSNTSTQRSVKITYSQWKTAGTLVHIETTATPHVDVLTFAPSKQYRSVVFSSPALTAGTSYDLYTGGSSTGTVTDGLYQGGTYSGGTKTNTFVTNNVVTNVNAP